MGRGGTQRRVAARRSRGRDAVSGRDAAGTADLAAALRLLSAHLTHRSRRVSVHGAWLDHDGRTRSPIAGRRRRANFARQQQQRIRAVRETGQVKFDYNCFHQHTLVASENLLTAARHQIAVKIEKTEKTAACASLLVDASRWRKVRSRSAAHNFQHRHGPRAEPFADQRGLPVAVRISGTDPERVFRLPTGPQDREIDAKYERYDAPVDFVRRSQCHATRRIASPC